MNYINAFLHKELWEIKSSWKKLMWMSFIVLLPLIFLYNSRFEIIPKQMQPIYLVTLVAFAVSGQLSSNSLIREKNYKTLDIILCDNIPKYSVVIGKILPATIIGYIYCIVSLLLLKITVFSIYGSNLRIEITQLFIILPLAIAYLGSSASVLANLIIRDERVISLMSLIICLLVSGCVYLVNTHILQINIYINSLLILILSFVLNIISVFILKHSSSLLIKF
ncbi:MULTISPECIES: hypothetical protein [Clostridium]|uniref:hypothetical protein n=1 Tax=Clostridium TaxID=1485 RepID=UPI000E031FCC|nr:hypothetical protein [Clostridium sporogenes]MCW6086529.1 hypothetical protein [Clostridium sporogenes]STE73764.1 Uncharacterised protein [Clostridium botulinum]